MAERLKIRMTGLDQRIIELSGGNQQKAVFAKALMTNPKVFLCDEPTQAVDIMTRNEIHKLLREKADAGNAVVYVSSDLKEILEVADTIQLVVQGETRQLLVNERLLAKLFKEVLGVEVSLPIQRMTWQEAMDRFGSDKPDIRFGMELTNVTDVVKDCEFVVFKNALENAPTHINPA